MVCATGSEAAAGSAAKAADGANGAEGADAAGTNAAIEAGVLCCTASLAALTCDEDDEVAEGVEDMAGGAESSAPQALKPMLDAIVAMASKAALPRHLSLFISASVFVKARAVSNPFKK